MHNTLEDLIRKLGRLPGLGPRSARRAVLFLLKNRDRLMLPLANDMNDVARNIRACVECGNLDITDRCSICSDPRRDHSRICVVEDVGDLWAMERASVYRGLYHILGGTLSAIDGRGPDDLLIDRLLIRAGDDRVDEVILALSATVDGQTTAHYIGERLAATAVDVTRLARGMPVGGELDYLDDGTLAQALQARSKLEL
ncbi:MAG: recombination protein RecR [Alphaproteobacteria bacterium]|jgi:recombination protein RecR|nr:recombination protein RecR [Alphaproteobacteria bacterium]